MIQLSLLTQKVKAHKSPIYAAKDWSMQSMVVVALVVVHDALSSHVHVYLFVLHHNENGSETPHPLNPK